MLRTKVDRNSLRRTSGGLQEAITSIVFNGQIATGPVITIDSPMLRIFGVGTNGWRIDNGNVGLPTWSPNIQVNVSQDNVMEVTLGGATQFDFPTASREGQELTWLISQDGVTPGVVPTWFAGVGGWSFANAASPQGVKLADVNALFAAMPINTAARVVFKYRAAVVKWECVSLAGYWP